MNKPTDLPFEALPDLEAEAADWVARADAGLSAAEAGELARWRALSPEREDAYARLSLNWRFMAGLREVPNALPQAPGKRRSPWLVFAGAAALAALFFLCLRVAVPGPGVPASAFYETAASETGRSLSLADGSVVELAAATRLSVRFSRGRRDIELLSGEANFSVAKDKARPFVVQAGAVSVRAVGTVFRVQRLADKVAVQVSEGRVQVKGSPQVMAAMQAGASSSGLFLAAGESTEVSMHPATVAPEAPVRAEESISSSSLRFEEKPLREVVEIFNRHNDVQIVLGDPSLGALPLSGSFRPDNVEAFVRLLEGAGTVRVERRASGEIVLLPLR